MNARLLKYSKLLQALAMFVAVSGIHFAFAGLSEDHKNLLGRWKLIESKMFFADGRETRTQAPCWMEYSAQHQSSECETPLGKKKALYQFKLVAPGQYVVSRAELDEQNNQVELVSKVVFRVEGRFLYLTVYPEPRSANFRKENNWNPVRLEVLSVRE